jgi:uncharacterized membrane protein
MKTIYQIVGIFNIAVGVATDGLFHMVSLLAIGIFCIIESNKKQYD